MPVCGGVFRAALRRVHGSSSGLARSIASNLGGHCWYAQVQSPILRLMRRSRAAASSIYSRISCTLIWTAALSSLCSKTGGSHFTPVPLLLRPPACTTAAPGVSGFRQAGTSMIRSTARDSMTREAISPLAVGNGRNHAVLFAPRTSATENGISARERPQRGALLKFAQRAENTRTSPGPIPQRSTRRPGTSTPH